MSCYVGYEFWRQNSKIGESFLMDVSCRPADDINNSVLRYTCIVQKRRMRFMSGKMSSERIRHIAGELVKVLRDCKDGGCF